MKKFAVPVKGCNIEGLDMHAGVLYDGVRLSVGDEGEEESEQRKI